MVEQKETLASLRRAGHGQTALGVGDLDEWDGIVVWENIDGINPRNKMSLQVENAIEGRFYSFLC